MPKATTEWDRVREMGRRGRDMEGDLIPSDTPESAESRRAVAEAMARPVQLPAPTPRVISVDEARRELWREIILARVSGGGYQDRFTAGDIRNDAAVILAAIEAGPTSKESA